MKKYSFLLLVAVAVGVVWWRFGSREGSRDYKLGVVSNEGVEIVSISFDRKMVNSLRLEGETKLWIPEGLDWYEVDKIKKLLEQEDKHDLATDIFFYNLGFLVDKVVFLDGFDWNRTLVLLPNLGFFQWMKFFYWQEQMLFKEEVLEGDLLSNGWILDEVMIRDFGDSRLLNEDLRLTVFNTTDYGGLAGFVARRLSWAGFSVMGVGSKEERVDSCRLAYGSGADQTHGWKVLGAVFDCEEVEDGALSDYEVEVYIGEKFYQVINYSGYVGAF